MQEVAYVSVTSGCLKLIRFEHLHFLQDLRFGTLGKGAVCLFGGWDLLGVVWLVLYSGADTLLIVLCSWARPSTWRVIRTKLYSGL